MNAEIMLEQLLGVLSDELLTPNQKVEEMQKRARAYHRDKNKPVNDLSSKGLSNPLTHSQLEDLNLSQLKQLKKELYDEALQCNLPLKLATITRYLGMAETEWSKTGSPSNRLWLSKPCEIGCHYSKCDGLVIFRSHYMGYTRVWVDGDLVFSTHPTNTLFVPGSWVGEVEDQFVKASQKYHAQKTQEMIQKRTDIINELIAT